MGARIMAVVPESPRRGLAADGAYPMGAGGEGGELETNWKQSA